jgi:hypothetical protein
MCYTQNIILTFVDLLSSHLDVLSCKEEEGIYKIYTSKYIIHIYKSGQNRVENVSRAIIHLDIDLLQHSPIKILNRLKGLHGLGSRLYARKTVVARIDKKVALNFQEEHHLQLAIPGKYRYGLFYEGDLVSIAIIFITLYSLTAFICYVINVSIS